ncbi:uncharacterized protein C18orf63-like [Lasioglossum baleicum]|uniref:uncharacterized protein C18orf63-like n=1 Tax=Lasioglossum baleicum TaxID=434251 RepID=UPI003FCEB884
MDIPNIAYKNKQDTIVYASLPQMNELCCTICKLDFIEVHESSAKSNFHWKIMKCRLLIYLASDIIASPISGTQNYIFVITRKAFSESGKLEQLLRYLKLVYQGQRPITKEIYKQCLFYTIQTKIAPVWNKVGQYFLQGKEFLTSVERIIKALKVDILVQERDVCLVLRAECVNMPYVKLEDFLPSFVISQFLADPKGRIDLSGYDSPFVYVLPSTKRGKLIAVSKEIPECAFKDYDHMRRHWKNMYGYSLPKDKNGILFFEIKFPVPRSCGYIYPDICVMSGPLDIIPNREKECTVARFIGDTFAKSPTICGTEFKLSKHTFCNTETTNANVTSDISAQNKKLITPLKRKYESTLTAPLESSANCVTELKGNIETVSKPLKTQLAQIHPIHNTFQCSINRAVSNIKKIECNENGGLSSGTQITKKDRNEAGTSRILNINTAESKQETISTYFKIHKPPIYNDKKESAPYQSQNGLTLKEKLLQVKPNVQEAAGDFIPEDQHMDVEKMAKSNKLHLAKNSVLSEWLKIRSIPHTSRATKAELINKILSHIRNTQMLTQFRI